MKAEFLTGELPPPPPPLVCRTSMDVINLNAPSDARTTLLMYGADFLPMYADSFSIVFVSSTGDEYLYEEDVFLRQSSYKYVLNLSRIDDDFFEDWSYLSIRFNDEEISAVGIIPQDPPVPPSPIEIDRTPGVYSFIPPYLNNGEDRDFGKGMHVTVHAFVRHTRTQAYVQMWMYATDIKNETVAMGWSPRFYFFQAPYGSYIKGIVDEDNALVEEQSYYFQVHQYIWEEGTNEFHTDLGTANITGYTSGPDAGISTGVKFQFAKPFKFLVQEEE